MGAATHRTPSRPPPRGGAAQRTWLRPVPGPFPVHGHGKWRPSFRVFVSRLWAPNPPVQAHVQTKHLPEGCSSVASQEWGPPRRRGPPSDRAHSGPVSTSCAGLQARGRELGACGAGGVFSVRSFQAKQRTGSRSSWTRLATREGETACGATPAASGPAALAALCGSAAPDAPARLPPVSSRCAAVSSANRAVSGREKAGPGPDRPPHRDSAASRVS